MSQEASDHEYELEHLRLQRPHVLPEPDDVGTPRPPWLARMSGSTWARVAVSASVVMALVIVAAVAASGSHSHSHNPAAPYPAALSEPDGVLPNVGAPNASDTGDPNATDPNAPDPNAIASGQSSAQSVGRIRVGPSVSKPIGGGPGPAQPNTRPHSKPKTHKTSPPKKKAPPAKPSGRELVSDESGKCLRANPSDGSPVQLSTCSGAASQRWTIHSDGTIRTGGFCMDAAWAGTSNGTRVQVARCSGNKAQLFDLNGAADLVNLPADKCADVVDHKTASGTPIQIWSCTGASNQKWTLR
jgi:hypothetical protein